MQDGNHKHQWQGAIKASSEGPICFITLDRPDKANAYTTIMLEQLYGALNDFMNNPQNSVLVISGNGDKAFCGGADLNEIHVRNYAEGLDLFSAKVFAALARTPKITIAAINGAAIGGGFELALACDLRICSSNTIFRFPETEFGLVPAAGGLERLPTIVGIGKAKEIILGGVSWDAEEALRYGLVSKVVPLQKLYTEAKQWALSIARRDPLALALAKNAMTIDADDQRRYSISKLSEALLYERQANRRNK